MMDFITAPLIVGICVLGIYKLFELFARRRERLTIIEKFNGEISPANLTMPSFSETRFSYGALKIGCLLIGLGIGLLLGFVICSAHIPNYIQNLNNWEYRQITSMVYGACVLMFGGIGLLIAFAVEMRLSKKAKKES